MDEWLFWEERRHSAKSHLLVFGPVLQPLKPAVKVLGYIYGNTKHYLSHHHSQEQPNKYAEETMQAFFTLLAPNSLGMLYKLTDVLSN